MLPLGHPEDIPSLRRDRAVGAPHGLLFDLGQSEGEEKDEWDIGLLGLALLVS